MVLREIRKIVGEIYERVTPKEIKQRNDIDSRRDGGSRQRTRLVRILQKEFRRDYSESSARGTDKTAYGVICI